MLLLIRRECFFKTRKYQIIIHFLCYKCLNCVTPTQIMSAEGYGTQMRQIYEDKRSSRQNQSPHTIRSPQRTDNDFDPCTKKVNKLLNSSSSTIHSVQMCIILTRNLFLKLHA